MMGLMIALVSIIGVQFFVVVALFSDLNDIKMMLKRTTNTEIIDFRRGKK